MILCRHFIKLSNLFYQIYLCVRCVITFWTVRFLLGSSVSCNYSNWAFFRMTFKDINLSLQVITHEVSKKFNLRRLLYNGIRRSCVKIENIAQFGQTGSDCSVHRLFSWCGLFHIVPSACTKWNFWSSKQYVNMVIVLNLNIYYRQ
jgi:hypothetical protein